MRSQVGTAAKYITKKQADSGKTQGNAAASNRQEPISDYGAADDEFPQGTITNSIYARRLLKRCNRKAVAVSATTQKTHVARS